MSWLSYTRWRYLTFMGIGAIGVIAAMALNLSVAISDYSDRLAVFERDSNITIYNETRRTQATVKSDLRLLSSLSIDNISMLQFNNKLLNAWLKNTFVEFMDERTRISALALYDGKGERIFDTDRRGNDHSKFQSPCLSAHLPSEGFCVYRGLLAENISIPILDDASNQRGTLVALMVLSPQRLRGIREEMKISVYLFVDNEPLYSLDSRENQRDILSVTRLGLWVWNGKVFFANKLILGKQGEITIVCLRPASAFIMNCIQGIVMILVIGVSYFGILQYFVVNYHMISMSYRNIFDSLPDLICLTDDDGRIKYINRSMAETLFHRTPKTIVTGSPSSYPPSDIYAIVKSDELDTRQSMTLQQHEIVHDGRVYSVVQVPVIYRKMIEDRVEVVTCIRDLTTQVTERQHAEQWQQSALTAQRTLQTIFDHSPEWLCIFDQCGEVLSMGLSMSQTLREIDVDVRQDLLDAIEHLHQRLTLKLGGRIFTATCLPLQETPPRYLLIANDMTPHAAWQEELESVVAMVTEHITHQNRQKKRTDRIRNNEAS